MITTKKLKATRFFSPYSPEGNYNLKTTGKGCYIIKKAGEVVYVGLSLTDVQKTMYRHFQKWTDRRTSWTKKHGAPYERVTYYGERKSMFLVKVIFCPTNNETRTLENLLIRKLKPRDNTLKLDLYNQFEADKMQFKFNDAEAWKPVQEEAPF